MVTDAASGARPRRRLSRERVVCAAIELADEGGLEALTMRTLAEKLEVAPMALYRHVADKDDLIDAMVDAVFTEIGVPSAAATGRPPCAGGRTSSAKPCRATAGRSA